LHQAELNKLGLLTKYYTSSKVGDDQMGKFPESFHIDKAMKKQGALFYEVGGRFTSETKTKTVVITLCSRQVSTYSTRL
jgi:hypothetical protein